jgi:hypothetical protein
MPAMPPGGGMEHLLPMRFRQGFGLCYGPAK